MRSSHEGRFGWLLRAAEYSSLRAVTSNQGEQETALPARHGPVAGKVFAVGFDLELAARS